MNPAEIATATAAAFDTVLIGLKSKLSLGDDADAALTEARDTCSIVAAHALDLVLAADEPDATTELKFDPTGSGIVCGYASLFGDPADSVNDIVSPGAFRDARRLPDMLREHKSDPIGEWTSVEEDEIGLRVVGKVTDVATLSDLKEGRLDGLSIGYRATKSRKDAKGRRVLERVDLQEISIVKRPASSRARVLSVKSANAGKDTNMLDLETGTDSVAETKSITDSLVSLGQRLDRLETVARRPGAPALVETKGDNGATVFTNFLRRGAESLDPVERKSLRVDTAASGGFLVPDEFAREIVKNIVQFSPIRSIARVAPMSGQQLLLPKRSGTVAATWVGEVDARSSTEATYGQLVFNAKELACYVDVSNALLEDSAFDIANELAMDFAEQFAASEGTAFVNGNGSSEPSGFMLNSDISYTASGSGSAVTADGLIGLYHDLKPAYRNAAAWLMNSSTLSAVRKLKDGTTGQYLLTTAGQFGGVPQNSLFGRPVIECVDMPDIAGNAYPIAFGDFNSGYRVFDRVGMTILRDPYTVATSGLTRFHARRRVAGGVSKPEAIRKLKISA